MTQKFLKSLKVKSGSSELEHKKLQHRLLAFWDKRNNKNTLVVCTHGFIKKTDKVPKSEIDKAKKIMRVYFETY